MRPTSLFEKVCVLTLVVICFIAIVAFSYYLFPYVFAPIPAPAVLPDDLRDESTISSMAVGDVRYAAPKAMVVDWDGRCYLIMTAPTNFLSGGYMCMKIVRKKDGYHVYAGSTGWHWKLGDRCGWPRDELTPITQVY